MIKNILINNQDISKYDKDVIINKDVWIKCNVTIFKCVNIGEGAILLLDL